MQGKRGLIMGVANDRSLAWGIASELAAQGAEIAFSYQGEALEKRVRRYKRRLKKHHGNGREPLPTESAAYYMLAPYDENDGDEGAAADGDPTPVVVAERVTALREMTVGAAVMQLDLAESPAIVFKNAAHGRLNVVYRRRDGHIGWIDPAA